MNISESEHIVSFQHELSVVQSQLTLDVEFPAVASEMRCPVVSDSACFFSQSIKVEPGITACNQTPLWRQH